MEPRWGTPVASYVAGLLPDARPLDRGKPRDEDTEGGTQPADKSLINRRLQLHPQPCAVFSLPNSDLDPEAGPRSCCSTLDWGHKRLAKTIAGNNRDSVLGIKALLVAQQRQSVEQQFAEERHYTNHVLRGAKAEDAFPEFIARKGRPLG